MGPKKGTYAHFWINSASFGSTGLKRFSKVTSFILPSTSLLPLPDSPQLSSVLASATTPSFSKCGLPESEPDYPYIPLEHQ